MIQEKNPITMAEVLEILKKSDTEKAQIMSDFIKKFIKTKPEDAKKIKEDLKTLDLAKLREEDIVKIIDFMPEDAEDLRKIFTSSDVSLEQEEITKILETIKKKK
jgi:DNA-directed RNA polymerase subunit F